MDAAGTELKVYGIDRLAHKEPESQRVWPDIELQNKSHLRPNSKRHNYTSQLMI